MGGVGIDGEERNGLKFILDRGGTMSFIILWPLRFAYVLCFANDF